MLERTLACFGSGCPQPLAFDHHGVSVEMDSAVGDPETVYRLCLRRKGGSVEICPSKGLSVRNAELAGQSVFWDSPLESLPDPDEIDLTASMTINGTPTPGSAWAAYFGAGIEMLGLFNWGMPVYDKGELLSLHGNASSIPVETVDVVLDDGGASVTGEFFVSDANGCRTSSDVPPVYQVSKRIELMAGRDALFFTDTVTNVSGEERIPDWGYHVQLRPEEGCRFHLPSERVLPRGGGVLPEDWELWHRARIPSRREERGYVHKEPIVGAEFPDGSPAVESRMTYPDGRSTRCLLPPSPYMLSWFSCGGASGDEFRWSDDRVFEQKDWNGVGPEIGASSLDHDGDTDSSIQNKVLLPGESLTLNILVEAILPFEGDFA